MYEELKANYVAPVAAKPKPGKQPLRASQQAGAGGGEPKVEAKSAEEALDTALENM